MDKKTFTDLDTILFVESYESGLMCWGVSVAGRLRRYRTTIKKLDLELLSLLDRRANIRRLRAIVVARHQLGGFASSRLILSTVNIIAWAKDLPIVSVPIRGKKSWSVSAEALERLVGLRRRFQRQILPQYQYSPDIGRSKKVMKFTIS